MYGVCIFFLRIDNLYDILFCYTHFSYYFITLQQSLRI